MKRRAFIALLGGAVLAQPTAALAQTAKLPTIGLLGAGSEKAWSPLFAAFQ